ncbi:MULTISPECIES: DUF2255 family protein [unclassified Lactococcus]|uniref:DUF2255 family protein n=1 Tax=unclassified Lactococcus TaxID=2643510 RepID=UPI0011CB40FF|nr:MULTISPECIES: DUF2255 family protein [unclassified Lactococcus]MQW23287.1 DUF2255 family protein [Lactococcus sp. dk101]TXK38047.1 DUF2255 family protein [Lactococcus sp. dk310]TXK49726.1 DUF2255 family protein [Lactococcus sp. dk322]
MAEHVLILAIPDFHQPEAVELGYVEYENEIYIWGYNAPNQQWYQLAREVQKGQIKINSTISDVTISVPENIDFKEIHKLFLKEFSSFGGSLLHLDKAPQQILKLEIK